MIDNVNERDFEDLRNMRTAFIQTGWKFLITTRTAPDEFVAMDVDELDMEDAVLLFVYHNTTTQIDHIDPARINEQLRNVIDQEGIKANVEKLLTHIVKAYPAYRTVGQSR
ncbi:hypothetical protein [Paraflavitalea speifideaquila]|uniref:hypothetical protein n=1 Tax=Paraflavitalea speifideaquila TaxID=3076558 RepID=UPI0028E5190E|nr:hypothetical protein [Paraflavitalea speifideiaquila]